jgi:hypothetical protein
MSNNASFRKPCSTNCRKPKRTSMIRLKRPSESSPQCPTRRRFSTQAQKRSTARSPIESLCRRVSFSRALKNITPQRCTRQSIAPGVRNALARGDLRCRVFWFPRLLKRRNVCGDGSGFPLRRSRNINRRPRESGSLRCLWLLKIPNAPKSLEFLDSPTQYRRHVHARAIDRFSACMPIP